MSHLFGNEKLLSLNWCCCSLSGVLAPSFTILVFLFLITGTFAIESLHSVLNGGIFVNFFSLFGLIGIGVVSNGLLCLWVSVHEEINHNFPRSVTWDFTSELEHFTGKEPEAESNGVARLVVSWDSNINVVEW